ncbi:MAG TPA: hypothetical protein VLT59_10370 [Steroidobacteraceae bacterium]|nr:hypothetical protein [Steroidobacteraceae bacterium]
MTPQNSVTTGRDALLRLINEDVGTGKFFNVFAESRVNAQAYDEAARDQLMKVSEELVAARVGEFD